MLVQWMLNADSAAAAAAALEQTQVSWSWMSELCDPGQWGPQQTAPFIHNHRSITQTAPPGRRSAFCDLLFIFVKNAASCDPGLVVDVD